MNIKAFVCYCLLMLCFNVAAQHRIEVNLQNYKQDTLVLGYHEGGERYFLDTAFRTSSDMFVFEGKTDLPQGLYTIYLLPDGVFFEFVVETSQKMRFSSKADSLFEAMKVVGSPENSLYLECQKIALDAQIYNNSQREWVTMLRRANAKEDADALERSLILRADSIGQVQAALVENAPNSLVRAIVRANRQLAPPQFGGDRAKQFWYLKSHFFDDVDLADVRLIRTPYPFEKLATYLKKLTAFHPDSLNATTDYLLGLTAKSDTAFRYYFDYLYHYFSQTEDMGMDGCYVHLVEKYIMQGRYPWVGAKDMAAMATAIETMKLTLIGQIAPDITLDRQDSSTVNLHSIQSPILVLIFWDPDCQHCQHHMPDLIAMHDRVKNRGVKFVGICTRLGPTYRRCYEYADFLATPWETLTDHDLKSRFLSKYNLSQYPKFFILNAEKRIIAKNIKAENLESALMQLTKNRQ